MSLGVRRLPQLSPEEWSLSWNLSSPFEAAERTRCLWSSGFTASLIPLYERFGLDTPRHITGPSAWVLWDAPHRRLVAVRDRMGTRGLYYIFQDGMLHLADGVEPLLALLSSPPSPNPRAVAAHLQGRVPDPGETFYEGIQSVRPGETLVVNKEGIRHQLYWRIEPQPPLRLPDDEAYARALRERLFSIVAEYAPDGPVGVTLSSGLDSTSIAAALTHTEARPTAFTWTAPELPEADETAGALATARKLGYPVVTIAADQRWPLREEPCPEPETPLFNYYTGLWEETFRKTRENGTTVLLSGFGGDYLFGGDVFSYPDLLLTGRWRRLGREIREHLPFSSLRLPGLLRRMVLAPIVRSFPRPRGLLPGRRARLRLLGDPFIPAVASLITTHAARHGIDFRHPLLDHRLLEFAASLPASQTFAAGRRKIILRNAVRDLLPAEVVERRDKIYPVAIVHRGLRERERARIQALMTDMRAARMGFVDEARLREEYRRYLAGATQSTLFWHSLTLEAWLRRYFPA
jgi:asparagine synthase (glutamine-hydrolysing)